MSITHGPTGLTAFTAACDLACASRQGCLRSWFTHPDGRPRTLMPPCLAPHDRKQRIVILTPSNCYRAPHLTDAYDREDSRSVDLAGWTSASPSRSPPSLARSAFPYRFELFSPLARTRQHWPDSSYLITERSKFYIYKRRPRLSFAFPHTRNGICAYFFTSKIWF